MRWVTKRLHPSATAPAPLSTLESTVANKSKIVPTPGIDNISHVFTWDWLNTKIPGVDPFPGPTWHPPAKQFPSRATT